MHSRFTVAFAGLISLVFSPAALGAQHLVTVGGPGVLKYDPESVNAAPGDTVVFNFKQKNHTATQSSFENPCQPISGGFDSGFIPVADSNVNGPFPAAQFTVKDTNPVWVYCRQANHCQQGMVFAINPGDKFSAFQIAAMGLTSNTTNPASSPSASPGSNVSTTPPPASSPPSQSTAAPSVVTVTATVTVSGQQQVTTYASTAASPAPTASFTSDHIVVVGGPNKLLFQPSNITAQVGDTITFQFMQKNHTATQSSFANPCESLTKTSTTGQTGFDSGFMPVGDNATTFPSFTIQINDTAPIWAFCRQTAPSSHCAAGMVFSVNAVESGANNFEAFLAKATQSNGTISNASSGKANGAAEVNHGAGVLVAFLGLVLGMML